MANFVITTKCEEVNESSYTVQSTGEVVTTIQLSLVVPSTRDRVLCELPLEKAPTTDQLSAWELDESWLVVSAEGMRALAFARNNAASGRSPSALNCMSSVNDRIAWSPRATATISRSR